MPSEFDNYAAKYQELLRDPIRDKFAPGSQFFMLRKWWLLHDFLISRGATANTQAWLDVGCGQGELLKLGQSFFARVAGCDPSAEMLAHTAGLDVKIQSAPDLLPYDSESIDLVSAVCVYHHVLTDPMRHALTVEVRRILKPGGVFCIIEHNPLNPATQLIVRRTPVDADARLLRASESCRLLRAAGLRLIHKEYFLYLPESLYQKISFVESALKQFPLGGQYAVFGEKGR